MKKKVMVAALAFALVFTPITAHGMDLATQNAYDKALSYLSHSGFSKKGLIDQLSSPYGEGFTKEQAEGAVNLIDVTGKVNWALEALEKAHSYLESSSFSKQGLIEQLEFEDFTDEESVFAVENCGANWNEQAAKKAKSYLESGSFSRKSLIEQLEFEKFTHKQAVYGVNQVGL